MQCRYDLVRKEANRAQTFLPGQIAEGELADDIIALRLGELAGEKIPHGHGRAGNPLPAFHERVEIRRPWMGLRPASGAEQMREAVVPDRIGAAGELQRLRVGFGNDDKAPEAELRQARARIRRPPDGAIAFDRESGFARRIEADDMEIAPRRALGAVRRMDAVPDRRMRLLKRRKLHRYIVEREMLAVEIEPLLRQALKDQFDALGVNLLRYVCASAVKRKLDRRGAASEAEFKAPAADLVEHADFFDQAQRMIERQHEDHGPKAQSPCPLCQRGEKDIR